MKKFILLIYMFLLKISKSTLTSSYIYLCIHMKLLNSFFFVWGGGCGLLFAAVLMSGHIQPINARNLTALHALKCGNLLCVELHFFFLCNLGDIPCNVTI